MLKVYLAIISVLIALIAFSYIWIISPNKDEKASHKATFCNVLLQDPSLKSSTAIYKKVKYTFGNSTPSYAYHKPKFYKKYTKDLIKHYKHLNPEDKQRATKNHDSCFEIMSE
jgi:hypothetical protein